MRELYMMEQGPESAHANPDRWTAFEKFEAEYASQSHRRIAAAWNQELFYHFQPAEKYRTEVALANECVSKLERLVAEYRRGHWQGVVKLYDADREHFDVCTDFLTGYKQHVDEARKQVVALFRQRLTLALDQNDDEALEKILFEGGQGYQPRAALDYFEREKILTAEERKRLALALERLSTIRHIEGYLSRKDTQAQALELFDAQATELRLEDSKALSRFDRTALYEARRANARDTLREAVIRGDDDEILFASNAALAVGWTLPETTLDRVRLAGQRKAARERVAQANNERDLFIAFDDALTDDRQPGEGGREALGNRNRLYKPLLALKRAIRRNDFRAAASLLRDAPDVRELAAHLDDSENAIVASVQAAVQTLNQLRELIAVQPRTEAVVKQIVNLTDKQETLQTLNLLMSAYEKEQVRIALVTHAAVDELKRLDQAPEMPLIKLAIAKTFNKAHEAGVVLPNSLNWGKIRAAVNFETQWSALTRAIDAADERAIFVAWNPTLLYEGLELLGERDKQTLLKALQKTSRDERLKSALASNDAERIAFAKRELAEPTDASKPN